MYNVTQYLRTRNRVITILQKRNEGDFLYKLLLFLLPKWCFHSVKEQMEEATLFLAAPTSSNVFKKKKNLNNVSPPWSLQRIHTIVRD